MFRQNAGELFVLASGSPRRRELLGGIGLQFEVLVSNCDESVLVNESPEEMVTRLALLKAQTAAALRPKAWVLGADTTVVIDQRILGKPENAEHALEMLSTLQGREHEVWGGMALVNHAAGTAKVFSSRSLVRMREMSADFMRAYIATNEPMDKAGAYAIQGVGASIVKSVTGSYTNVVGLDLARLVEHLLALGVISLA